MKITITQTQTDVIQAITFTAEAENPVAFKTAVRTWMTAKYPAMTLAEIFGRITSFTVQNISLDMT